MLRELNFDDEPRFVENIYSEYDRDEWKPGDPITSYALQNHLTEWRQNKDNREDF